MASLERASFFRHEGHIFFIYDHTKKTEEDDPKDAILYFYPGFVGVEVQIALVGGIIGLVDFCLEFLPQSMPSIVKLSGRHFALLQHEDFIIGLGGSPDTPDAFLTAHMQFVWSTFVLYQGSLSALRKRVSTDSFLRELKNVWDYYLPLRQIQEDSLSQAFQVLPYVQLHKSQGHLFLHASHILQRSLTHKGVLAGALFNKTRVLCTQLSNSLTRQFLLLMSQSQFPCVEANSVLELPGGVRLLHIYLPRNEYARLGYRRKKAYIHFKPDTKSQERSSADSVNRSIHPSLSTPDFTSAQNFFTDGLVSCAGGLTVSVKSPSFDGGSSDTRSSSGREASGLMASPLGGVASGTDSEVFLDTLSDMIIDSENSLKLADIKQVECATSGREISSSQLRQTLSRSVPMLDQVSSNSSLSLKSNNPSLSQDSISPSPSQDSSSPLPSQGSSCPSPSQYSSSVSSGQDKFSPVPTQNSYKSSPIQDSSSPSQFQKSNGSAVTQNNNNQDSSIISLIQESHNPALTQNRTNPLIAGSHSPSPSQNTCSPSKSQESDYPVLSENIAPVQIKINAEQNCEEKKPQLQLNQLRDLSFSGETREEDGSGNEILITGLPLNKSGSESSEKESVMVDDQEHCGGLESSAHEVTEDLISVTMVTDSVAQSAMFTHSYSDSVDSAEPGNTCSQFNNSVSSDQQQNKKDLEVNLNGDRLDMITGCHDNGSVTETDSREVNTISQFQNGRVTSEINLLVEDSTSSLELESEIKFNKTAYPNGEITSELMKPQRDPEENSSGHTRTLNIKPNSELGVPDNIQQAETSIGNQSGLSGSPGITVSGSAGLTVSGSPGMTASGSAGLTVSGSGNKDSRSERSLPSALSKQTFNVTEILAQNKEQIDASLETQLSGDESSTHSSSELKQDDHEVSSYLLAYSEVGANKDRLTFEFVDSEFSEGGLMSPISRQLSPVTESSGTTRDDLASGRSGFEPKSSHSRTNSDHKSEDLGANSPEWSPERDGLEELTLYAQGHSDTLLVLLVSHSVKWNKLNINSLWKSCLPHLAELDFQVKDAERHAKDESENVAAQHQYLKYDTFSQSLKGSALLPVTSLANEIVDSSIRMHDSFCSMPDLQEITYRSHSACCYGQRMVNTETYFQIGLPRMSAGICPPNDKTFCLDQMAEKILHND